MTSVLDPALLDRLPLELRAAVAEAVEARDVERDAALAAEREARLAAEQERKRWGGRPPAASSVPM